MTGALALGVILAGADSAQAAGAPQIDGGRTVAGTPRVGERLESTATATGARPLRTTYTWQRCTGMAIGSCTDVAGARRARYTVRPADEGAYLRSTVRVENARGWAWVTSAPTAAVAPRAAPAAPEPGSTGGVESVSEEHFPLLAPFPVVRIRGWLTSAGARVSLLTVRAPAGARISVACTGRGCPRSTWARQSALIHLRPFEIPLRAGVRLTIAVTRPGSVGKHTVITIRRGHTPARIDRCLYPGASRPVACPAR